MSQQEVTNPPYGALYSPSPKPETGRRVDLRGEDFEQSVLMHGHRLAWSRAADCPCAPVDEQLTHSDPTCPLCSNSRYFYFGPTSPQSLGQENLSTVQLNAIKRANAFVIRGVISSQSASDTDHDRLGFWRFGQAYLSVSAVNRIAYRDRLINLDASMSYNEVAVAPADPVAPLPLRYIVNGGVYLLRSTARELRGGQDYTVRDGNVYLSRNAVAVGTRLTCHYLTFPVYVIMDMPHFERLFPRRAAIGLAKKMPVNPEGTIQRLLLQARIQLQFIPQQATQGGQDDDSA